MLKQITLLKQERLSLTIGGASWIGLTSLLFEMAHMAWLLALSLAFFPSFFLFFATHAFFSKAKKTEIKPQQSQKLENPDSGVPIEVSNPKLDRFLLDFSHILEMQKKYWQEKTVFKEPSLEVLPAGDAVAFSVALQNYARSERAFALWQDYKKNVIEILRVQMCSGGVKVKEILVGRLSYELAERELYLFCPQQTVRDGIEEVRFFLQAIKSREKELEELKAYLEKLSADGIWLSPERKEKLKEYEKSKEICEKQLEMDRAEILRNLEEIFTAL